MSRIFPLLVCFNDIIFDLKPKLKTRNKNLLRVVIDTKMSKYYVINFLFHFKDINLKIFNFLKIYKILLYFKGALIWTH